MGLDSWLEQQKKFNYVTLGLQELWQYFSQFFDNCFSHFSNQNVKHLLFQFVKCKDFLLLLSSMIVNDKSLWCELFVGQKKQFWRCHFLLQWICYECSSQFLTINRFTFSLFAQILELLTPLLWSPAIDLLPHVPPTQERTWKQDSPFIQSLCHAAFLQRQNKTSRMQI